MIKYTTQSLFIRNSHTKGGKDMRGIILSVMKYSIKFLKNSLEKNKIKIKTANMVLCVFIFLIYIINTLRYVKYFCFISLSIWSVFLNVSLTLCHIIFFEFISIIIILIICFLFVKETSLSILFIFSKLRCYLS